jgi:hypothetical protein
VGDTHYLYLLGEAMPDGASSWLDGSKNKTRSLRKKWLRPDEIEKYPRNHKTIQESHQTHESQQGIPGVQGI